MSEMTIQFTDMTREQFQAHLDERSVNTHDAASVATFFSDDAVQRRVATGETAKGREAIREALEEMFRVFPDFYIEVRYLFAAKNRICVECTLTGTHEGESQGISPTGRRIEADICLVFRIGRDGLVEEKTIYSDSATMLRQLGLFAES